MRFRFLLPIVPLLLVAVRVGAASGTDAPGASTLESTTSAAPAMTAMPLEQLLDSDGRLDLESGYRGSLSAAGWRMVQGADGAPRFEREGGELDEAAVSPTNAAQATSDPADINWDDRFAWVTGMNGAIRAMVMDGSGSMYVGGSFTSAGGESAVRVAKWDGTNWSALGSGMNSEVLALAMDDGGNLYAGGFFTTAGGVGATRVAKWDGTNWSALGDGVNGTVWALATGPGGTLYAGGEFTSAGGNGANYIAKWDGTGWSALGAGVGASCYSLLVDPDGTLHAGGMFTTAGGVGANRIARWDGTSWSALGAGLAGTVRTMIRDGGGNLVAGRDGFSASSWNGSTWTALGSGTVNGGTYALGRGSGGDILAVGDFTRIGELWAGRVAKWNGTAWSRVSELLGIGLGGYFPNASALAMDGGGSVYLGGSFTLAGGAIASFVARWDGTGWWTLGTGLNGSAYALATDGAGNLYVGGTFTMAVGVSVNCIAKWDGASWAALGSGMNANGYVRALAVDGSGDLYAGGDFTTAGGVSANRVAKWDGTSWSALGSGMAGGASPFVTSLALDGSGNLWAGGEFTTAGDVSANRVAKWDGTSWSTLGSGMNYTVHALKFGPDGALYAGGDFVTAGGVSASRIAKWNGTTWSPLGAGMNAPVTALAFDGAGLLLAGGYFTTAGGTPANGVAQWNGSTWLPLGSGVNSVVYALLADGRGNRFAAGAFDIAGGKPSSGFGIWHVPPWFIDITAALPAVQEGSTAWGDYDGDGDLDLVLTGYDGVGYLSRIYRNDGAGTFTDIGAGLPGVAHSAVAWGDFDNDGDLDLALAGYNGTGYLSRIYRNDGAGTFTDIGAGLPGVIYGSLAWGDCDNDGDLDLALGGKLVNESSISRVYRNDGGVFVDVGAALTGVHLGALTWGDYDSDGDLDLMTTGRMADYDGTSRIYRNDGAGTFTDIGAGLPGLFLSSAAWGDHDADGDLDLALAGHDGSALLARVYRNDGGAFADVGAGLPGVYVCSLAWGDYDADGDLDLALTGYTGSAMLARVYRNDGSGTFTDVSAGLPGLWHGTAAWGDCDNDGDLDILMTGAMGVSSGVPINPVSRIYRSMDIPSNAPPAAPTGLYVRVSGEEATLNWAPPADAQTPAAGLSYDLRIGTTPGGSEIRAAMADPASGYRRVAQVGHAQQRTSWRLALPPGPGPWYWTVQAVDGGLAGSPFAPEQSFNPTTDVAKELPNELSFALAGANPVTGEARFRLALPARARVEVSIHDVTGRRVGTVVHREIEAGLHDLSWGAGEGRVARAGIYFARLAVDARVLMQKFVVLW